jgi:histone deacetylase 1/2
LQYYGPDYELDVRASNMENANSKDYLEKIKIQVIENLKKTAHAPSVQMTDVPRTTIMGGTDDDDAELDDLDEDENKDSRYTKRRFDQRIARDDELDDSEDDEEARANGVTPQNGTLKHRNIMDYQNSNTVASDVEMDSGIATPVLNDVDDMATAMATEANAEVNAEVMEQKSRSLTAAETGEAGPSNAPSRSHSVKPHLTVDNEGDVDMTEPAPEPAGQAPTSTAEAPISPTATVGPATPAPAATEPTAETDAATVKEKGEAERQNADVTGEASKEIAEKSQL